MNHTSQNIDVPESTLQISMKEYSSNVRESGIDAVEGDNDYLWIKFEGLSAIRFPEFNTSKPTKEEIRRVFRELKCLLLNYTLLPENNYANSTLYNCIDNDYGLQHLSKNARRDIRIAQRNLQFGFAHWNEILDCGLKAFADTRKRVGLSDCSEKSFRSRFTRFRKNPAHRAVAAWLDKEIIAFMSLIVLEDFVVIQGSFSTDDQKKICPNNGLVDFVNNYFLKVNGFSIVCYGLSSVQENTGKEGLHSYKVRVGFEAIPVQRVFVLHPLIVPFKEIIRLLLRLLKYLLPENRAIKKASGILESY
ncbi:MAG: hypothetical protein IH852_06455 [Bacteroidetes bacterium]|nr:hypothetical protein [Bacteroidota bacterium]